MKRDFSVYWFWISMSLMMTTATLACGPYLGSDLLKDHHGALLGIEEGSFSTESPLLVEPPAGLPRASEVLDREEMERRFLSASQFEQPALSRTGFR